MFGENWKALRYRNVSASLKFTSQDVDRSLGQTNSGAVHVTVVCVHAPIYQATSVKGGIFSDLPDMLDSVHEDDALLVGGDFNARVGSSERGPGDPAWDGVGGFDGVGVFHPSVF